MNALRARFVDIEGDVPAEVADVIQRVMRNQDPANVEQVTHAVLESLARIAASGAAAASTLEPIATQAMNSLAGAAPVEVITQPGGLAAVGATEAAEELAEHLYELAGEPAPTPDPVPDAPIPPGGYERWDQVPTARRVWSAAGTLHISREPDGIDLFCPLVIGGMAKPHTWMPPAASLATVCKACNKSIVREHRGDNA
jgi:hypothetical protein